MTPSNYGHQNYTTKASEKIRYYINCLIYIQYYILCRLYEGNTWQRLKMGLQKLTYEHIKLINAN